MIEVNEKENHSKEKKILKERDGADTAVAFTHTEPSGLVFWCLAQQWPSKASSELCPVVFHHHVVSWAGLDAIVDTLLLIIGLLC